MNPTHGHPCRPAILVAWLLASGCGQSTQVSSGAALPATTPLPNSACRLFSRRELGAWIGADVSAGLAGTAGPDSCRWTTMAADPRSVTVILVPLAEWRDGTGDPGGEPLPNLGERAFVAPWLDDQRAGARLADCGVYVLTPRRTLSVTMLRLAVARLAGHPPTSTPSPGESDAP